MREDTEYPVLARQEQDRQQAPGHADRFTCRFTAAARYSCAAVIVDSRGLAARRPGGTAGRCGLPSSARDERGDDICGVPVEAASGPVIPDRGPRISMRGSFLDVAQRHPRIERGGDERVA